MIGACLFAWCLGTSFHAGETRVVATQDVYNKTGATNRLIIGESTWLIGGYAYHPDTKDAVFVGTLPVRINLFGPRGPRVWLDGGAIVGTSPMPRRGTRANWIARVQVNVSQRVALEVVHISNGNLGNVPNPAIDSVGLSFRLK